MVRKVLHAAVQVVSIRLRESMAILVQPQLQRVVENRRALM
jgi:hypothetical protein